MKKFNLIIPILILSTIISSCNNEDDIDLSVQETCELDLSDDIIDEGIAFANDDFEKNILERDSSSSDFADMDNDGIADYAESNIENLDPNHFDDLLSMDPGTILKISTVDGVQEIPLYRTSFYQENMLQIGISSFSSRYPWTDTQKEKIKHSLSSIKKVWLTPEFQDYVKLKFKNDARVKSFFNKFKTTKRPIQFKYSSSAGVSNGWSYIGIAPWVMRSSYLHTVLSHELVHHLGIGHNGIPYGTEYKAGRMVREGKQNYPIFEINKKTNYINPCVPRAARNNNNYHSMHIIHIPNTGIHLRRHWRGNYMVYSTPVTFDRGKNYESRTRFLNGGRYSIWIDFNDDAKFDKNEQLLNNVRTSSRWKYAKYEFKIPEDAKKGIHRLRIVKSTYHSAQACSYIKGQAIDYTNVTIQ